jgi:predicted ATPase
MVCGDSSVSFETNFDDHECTTFTAWRLLVSKISPNALLDSSVRYDAPKCDEDTRVEVCSELMDWISDRGNPQRLLCMTGAAGSGKSTLQQTIAERCKTSGMLGSAYFLSSEDNTRNTVLNIVPTIAFQIGLHNPGLKDAISAVVAKNPVIFDKSLKSQMDGLLVDPVNDLREREGQEFATLPHAILIDGLDECKGEDRQEELLIAIRECLLENNLPFRVFIASRPEWAIRTALEQGGHLDEKAYHLRLSDEYDATEDMRRYLRRRFKALSPRTGNPHWFTESDIETFVGAGSGQFIYVATVFRYISQRRASPAERLKIALTWTPREVQRAQPLEELDKLYTNILSAAKDAYEAVDSHSGQDFLLLLGIHHVNVSSGFWSPVSARWRSFSSGYLTRVLGPGTESPQILFSDLNSLVEAREHPFHYLRVFHKSFSEFVHEKGRAKDLFVSPGRVHAHLAKCCLLHIIQSPDSDIRA